MNDVPDIPHNRITPLVLTFLAAVAVTLALFAYLYWQSDDRADDLQSENAASGVVSSSLATDVEALRAQILALGERPVAPDPEVTVREVIRETGEQGVAGLQGVQGIQGLAGRDGRDSITPACGFEAAQCQGAAGVDGRDGLDGAPGADSTVPGPQGPQGSQGIQGSPGPEPASFSFQWANKTFTCTDPNGDGAYECAAS